VRGWSHSNVRQQACEKPLENGNTSGITLRDCDFWSMSTVANLPMPPKTETLESELVVYGLGPDRLPRRWRLRLPVLASIRRQVRETRMPLA
jgi:hypothetical protein